MGIFKKLIISGSVLTFVGLTGVAPAIYFKTKNHPAYASSDVEEADFDLKKNPHLVSGKPIQISIKRLGIGLPVTDGEYNQQTGAWTLSDTHVNYAVMSAPANNQSGSTFIYGHYKEGIFANLHNISSGDRAIITTENGYRFIYEFRSSQTVAPSNGEILNYKGVSKLHIQTCTGAWMQNRQIFSLDFIKYEKIKQNKSVSNVLKSLSAELVAPARSTPSLNIRPELL